MKTNIVLTVMILISSLLLLINSGCGELQNQEIQTDDVWVFLTIRYDTNENYKFDFYFGTVDKSLYQNISKNRINQGFITLNNIRYWRENKIEIYEDDQDAGSRTYRIEDIREIKLKKGDPIYIYPDEDLSEKTKLYVAEQQKQILDSIIK